MYLLCDFCGRFLSLGRKMLLCLKQMLSHLPLPVSQILVVFFFFPMGDRFRVYIHKTSMEIFPL